MAEEQPAYGFAIDHQGILGRHEALIVAAHRNNDEWRIEAPLMHTDFGNDAAAAFMFIGIIRHRQNQGQDTLILLHENSSLWWRLENSDWGEP